MTEIMKGETEAIAKWEEICERHPEYTESEKTCLLYGLYAGKACEVCGNRIKQKLDYNKFVEANSTFVGFSEGALRPLIHEQDPEVQQKVISSVENAGKLKKAKFGTEEKMKSALIRAKGDKPIKEPEDTKKKALKALGMLADCGISGGLFTSIDKWIEEKYGK